MVSGIVSVKLGVKLTFVRQDRCFCAARVQSNRRLSVVIVHP